MFGKNQQPLGYAAPSQMTHAMHPGMQGMQGMMGMQGMHHGPVGLPFPGGPDWDPGVVNPFAVGESLCPPPVLPYQHFEMEMEVEEKCPSPKVHVVRKGDTLYKIARKYGRDWRELAGYNHLGNPDLIYPGQHILIPKC